MRRIVSVRRSRTQRGTHRKQHWTCEWGTPQKFFDEQNRIFQFTLDAAASDLNHKCRKYFTMREDGLSQSWAGERVWCNPPYDPSIYRWLGKAAAETGSFGECELAVLLLPSRTDQQWFHDYVYEESSPTKCDDYHFVKGRLRFERHIGKSITAMEGSLLVIYYGDSYKSRQQITTLAERGEIAIQRQTI